MRLHIEMKDGTLRKFPTNGDSYSPYSLTVKYEGAFVVIHEMTQRTAIPAADIREVREFSDRY